MARENMVLLIGKLEKQPIVYFTEDFGTYEIKLTLNVLRRNGRTEFPVVSVFGLQKEEAAAFYRKLKRGSFLVVKGMILTTMKPLKIKCGDCGHEKEVSTLQTEIASIGLPIVLQGNYAAEEFKEVSDVVNLIGRVCNTPNNRSTLGNTSITQYQVAVDRKFHIAEREDKTDYPWIKSFGQQADEDATRLQKGSIIYVTGAFQTRQTNKSILCDECARQLSYSETVGEIVSNDVEYLSNFKSDQTENAPDEL